MEGDEVRRRTRREALESYQLATQRKYLGKAKAVALSKMDSRSEIPRTGGGGALLFGFLSPPPP